MNRHLIHFLLLALLLPMGAGCSNSAFESAQSDSDKEGKMITFDMSLDFGGDAKSSTRTRSNFSDSISWGNSYTVSETNKAFINPDSAKIFILAFDENHLLTNVYTSAKYTSSDSDEGPYHYSLTMESTSLPRYLHVLVNFNELADHLNDIPLATESDVFNSSVMIAKNRAVYWRRIEMPDGISEETVKESLSNLKLVRNYAKLRLKFNLAETSKYKAEQFASFQWAIMCAPTMSYVAPYMNGQTFADYIDEETQKVYDYSYLFKTVGYRCHTPRTTANANTFYDMNSATDAANIGTTPNYDGTSRWKSWYEPIYCYENEGASESTAWENTMFLIKATTTDGEVWYYRITLTDPDTQESLYIMRNIEYTITITSINDKGFTTPEEAFTKVAGNNVVGSTRTSNFTSITYRDASLRVEYVKKYILSEAPFTMAFRYVPDIDVMTNGLYVTGNEYVELNAIDGYNFYGEDNTLYALKEKPTIDETNNTAATGEKATYRLVHFTPNKPQGNEINTISKFRVQVNDDRESYETNNVLYRDVELILRERYKIQNMEITSDTDQVNCYTLTVEIPNDMPEELFPLEFTFETSPACVYPNANKSIMQVSGTSESLFNSETYDSFNFIRTVKYSQYKNGYTIGNYDITFDEGSAGFKKITFYFCIMEENLPADGIVKFAVWNDDFSENPSNPYQDPSDSTKEIDENKVTSWPLFGTFKVAKDETTGNYVFTKQATTTGTTTD